MCSGCAGCQVCPGGVHFESRAGGDYGSRKRHCSRNELAYLGLEPRLHLGDCFPAEDDVISSLHCFLTVVDVAAAVLDAVHAEQLFAALVGEAHLGTIINPGPCASGRKGGHTAPLRKIGTQIQDDAACIQLDDHAGLVGGDELDLAFGANGELSPARKTDKDKTGLAVPGAQQGAGYEINEFAASHGAGLIGPGEEEFEVEILDPCDVSLVLADLSRRRQNACRGRLPQEQDWGSASSNG